MPCSVRLNDCCRREKTFPTMTSFKFDGAPGEHPGPEGFVTRPSHNPHWACCLTGPSPRVHGWRASMERERTSTEGVPLSVGHAIFLSSHAVHYNPIQVPCRVTRSDRPEMVHEIDVLGEWRA